MGTVKYTGPVASFHCPTNAEIRSLKVYFSPKQEGTGDPSPENVRPIVGWDGVKVEQSQNNLLDGQRLAEKIAASGGTIDNIAKTIVYSGSVANSVGIILDKFNYGKYTIIAKFTNTNSNQNLNMRVCYSDNSELLLNANNAVEIGTNIYKFTTAVNKQISNIKCSWIAGTTTLYFDIFGIYEGDINNFESYRGETTNYTFGALGKNKVNIGTVTFDVYKRYAFDPPLQPAQYTISALITSNDTHNSKSLVLFQDDQGTIFQTLIERDVRFSTTFTLSRAAKRIYIYAGPDYAKSSGDTATWSDIQLELGSTATTYEPYNPNHTVYGGWVDLITGEVCEEYSKAILDGDSNFEPPRDYDTYYRFHKNYSTLGLLEPKESQYPISNWLIGYFRPNGVYIGSTKNVLLYLNKDLNISTNEILSAYLAEHPLEMVYELATPNTYHLAPTQLQTFRGYNNVWSNADYVEVEYDLHETQDILARKNFIVANQPHVEEASGAIARFNTDMAAKLKECKVHFSPVQEGTGDPSPENVRPITGWAGVEVYRTGKNLFPVATGTELLNCSDSGTTKRIDIVGLDPSKSYTFQATWSAPWETDGGKRIYVNGESTEMIRPVTGETAPIHKTTTVKPSSDGTIFITANRTALNDASYAASLVNMQLEVGTAATPYEPYSGTTLPINWSDSAGAVYGGYVDLVKGEVVETWGGITLNGMMNAYVSGGSYRGTNCTDAWFDAGSYSWGYSASYATMSLDDSCCDAFKLVNKAIWGNPDLYPWHYVLNSTNQIHCVFVNNVVGITAEDTNAEAITKIKAWINNNPVAVKYKLGESKYIHHSIDPITLKSLRGINNVWSNANDNIKVTYYTH